MDHFELLMALFKANKRKKRFYEGRKPTLSDVRVLADKIEALVKRDRLEQ
jgi:hypothetical protein